MGALPGRRTGHDSAALGRVEELDRVADDVVALSARPLSVVGPFVVAEPALDADETSLGEVLAGDLGGAVPADDRDVVGLVAAVAADGQPEGGDGLSPLTVRVSGSSVSRPTRVTLFMMSGCSLVWVWLLVGEVERATSPAWPARDDQRESETRSAAEACSGPCRPRACWWR